eukprot:329742-Pelagomonas_calceolata.AAC.2
MVWWTCRLNKPHHLGAQTDSSGKGACEKSALYGEAGQTASWHCSLHGERRLSSIGKARELRHCMPPRSRRRLPHALLGRLEN